MANAGCTKPICLSAHAHGYVTKRGFTEAEVQDAIRTRPWKPAELNRLECSLELPFGAEWYGKYYAMKRVRPVFADNPDEIVGVTVYTYYY